MTQKIFCIGFHKTGTSSLAMALTILDYHVCRRLSMIQDKIPNSNIIEQLKKKEYQDIISVTEKFDAFCDNPWLLFYKELDEKYPNSKFILTTRNEESWIKSVVDYFRDSTSEIRTLIYGEASPIGHEALYLEKYRQHNSEVVAYFKNKPNKLLLFDLNENKKWDVLCSFLNKKIPSEPFPFENKTPMLGTQKKKSISFQRLLNYFKLPLEKKLLIIETFTILTFSRLLILIFPFRTIAKRLGKLFRESPHRITPSEQLKGKDIEKAIKKVSLYTPFRSLCFEQALTCKIMLNRRRISSTIYFGLAKENSNDSSQLKAHAWLRSGQHILTGNKGKDSFEVVALFG